MKLSMLYSTYGNKINGLIDNLPPKNNNVEIIIVHQNSQTEISDYFKERDDVTYIRSDTIGVTKSRNIAIENSTGDIVLFCDDDTTYIDNLYETVVSAYNGNENKFVSFAYSFTGNSWNNKFGKYKENHTIKSILSVGTIEISAKRDFIANNKITFPGDLGAGCKYPLCDEPVFLHRIMKAGGHGVYIPTVICEHPPISSGLNIDDPYKLKSRLICFKYIFGKLIGVMMFIAFIIKNKNRISKSALIKLRSA